MSRHRISRPRRPVHTLPVASSRRSWIGLPGLTGAVVIGLAALVAYLPSLSGKFLWDDDSFVAGNDLVQAPNGLYYLWFTRQAFDYWPLSYTTFWVEWRLWGMNPAGYHLTNLVLHISSCLLIWKILTKLSVPGGFLAGLLFAVHPVNVESVAWIAQRKNALALPFFLLSILWYCRADMGAKGASTAATAGARARVRPDFSGFSSRWYWLSLVAFTLGMLSKASVAVLPAILLWTIWWRRKVTARDLVRSAPFFFISSVLVLVNIWFQTKGTGEVIRSASFMERLLGAAGVIWFYLYKAILPLHLVFVYPQWHIQPADPRWWVPLLAAMGVTVLLWRYRKGWSRPWLFAWGFFCLALLPVMGFVDVYFMRYALVADHYEYIAMIAVVAAAAAGWSRWGEHSARGANLLAGMLACTLTCLTWQQSRTYKDNQTLFETTIARNPECWMAYHHLGVELLQSGRVSEARIFLEKTLSLNPNYPEALNNLAVVLAEEGNLKLAIETYQRALRLKPDDTLAWINLAEDYAAAGQPSNSMAAAQTALGTARLKGHTGLIGKIEDWIASHQQSSGTGQETKP